MGISEGLAYIVAEITIPRIKRRLFVMRAMFSSGMLCLVIALLTTFTRELTILELVLLFAMRFVICMLYAVMFIYVA